MKNHLLKYKRHCIYHFTDKRNIPEIKKNGGLIPRSMLEENDVPHIPGGNQWSIDADNHSGMQNFVHLCFLNDHPMEYRAKEEGRIDSIWLAVSTIILDSPGVLYCASVANQSGAVYLTAEKAIKTMDFDHLFNRYDFKIDDNMARHNEAKKYEILVPFKIPIEFIGGL